MLLFGAASDYDATAQLSTLTSASLRQPRTFSSLKGVLDASARESLGSSCAARKRLPVEICSLVQTGRRRSSSWSYHAVIVILLFDYGMDLGTMYSVKPERHRLEMSCPWQS
jgi:hypothetical protein